MSHAAATNSEEGGGSACYERALKSPPVGLESDGLDSLAAIAGAAKAERYLAGCPRTGSGVHTWIFNAALMCADATRWAEAEIHERLVDATADCGRFVPDGEIHRQVRAALMQIRGDVRDAHGTGKAGTRKNASKPKGRFCVPKWPNPDPQLIYGVITKSLVRSVADLSVRTHIPAGDLTAEAMIKELFPGSPWLCVGMASWNFVTRRKKLLLSSGSLNRFQFIVPSAMNSRVGLTKDGKLSEHAQSSVGPRQYLVIEADEGEINTQAAILWHLGGMLPLVCVVASQGKSLHGWFRCAGEAESRLLEFYRYARLLGADTAAWAISQFVRLPGGTRHGKQGHSGNGKSQTVIYFNPQETIR